MKFDNVLTDLDKSKSLEEYKYMFENYYIYTHKELRLILSTFTNNFNFDIYPDLVESYTHAFEYLQKQ